MKGMELARAFYDEVVRDLIHQSFPEYEPYIAVGLSGEGSECYGFDDEISRDHDWGVHLCLWMGEKVYEKAVIPLTKALTSLPHSYRGVPLIWVKGRHGVLNRDVYLKKYLGKTTAPLTVSEWLFVPMHHLSVVSNGAVFTDPEGAFQTVHDEVRAGYPEDIRLKKLAALCMRMAQSGVYNYPRSMKRGDMVAAQLALNEYMISAMQTVYLLNNSYAPFYKWMHHGLRYLEKAGEDVAALVCALAQEAEEEAVNRLVLQTTKCIVDAFRTQGISNEDTQAIDLTKHAASIHDHIENETLRNTDLWLSVI